VSSWRGPLDHDNVVNSLKKIYADKWDEFLILNSFNEDGMVGKSVVNVGGGHGKEAEYLLNKA